MQIFEMTPHYTLVRVGDSDPFTQPLHYVEYMQGAWTKEESLWLISLNPKCRPIARTLIKRGPLTAAMTSAREVFKVALRLDANAIAIVRSEPGAEVELTKQDRSAVRRYGETAGYLGIKFVDYLVVSMREERHGPRFCSWRRNGE